MVTPQHIESVVERYAVLLAAHDADGIAQLYSIDAIVEDPVGTPPLVGRDAILAFYRAAIERARPERLLITGPIRILANNTTAAVPLRSHGTREGVSVALDIIDVFTFDADGLIASMRAYWGPTNVKSR